jgi:threonine/homoserine/homoserine lactone efflux protein
MSGFLTGTFIAFLGVSILVIVTPGPDTALTIRNTLLGGRRGGVFAALGVATGQLIWALATSVGIVALLVASEPVFEAVKFLGAGYLVYLGGQALHAAWRNDGVPPAGAVAAGPRLGARASFVQGVISDLGNPKMAVFFASLLPQFTPDGTASFGALLFLGAVFCVLTFVWLAVYAALIARVGDVLRRPPIRRAVEGVTGAMLVALGIRLAAEQR